MNKVFSLTDLEFKKQKDTLNLIASENYPSPKVLKLLGSVWSNKYGEGYPQKRYYAGNRYTDDLENFVKSKALEVFQAEENYGVNVQVLSGSPANAMVYLSVLEYHDTILSLNVSNGGHISHLHPTSSWNKFFKLENYDVVETRKNNFEIDLKDYEFKLKTTKPKLVIVGFSAYPKKYSFKKMCKLAHDYGALVLADIAHINGLVAAGLHDSPFGSGVEAADFVSMTTHKTFRGPRGAMLFARNHIPEFITHHFTNQSKTPKSLIEIIDKTVFPGTSGGPHFNQIAAIGQACLEILSQDLYPDKISFTEYCCRVVENSRILETALGNRGLEIISPTENHLCLVKLPDNFDSLEIQQKLESVGIILNRNAIPFDAKKPWRPSGLRLGTAALTSRGLNKTKAVILGELIADTIFDRISLQKSQEIAQELVKDLNWYY